MNRHQFFFEENQAKNLRNRSRKKDTIPVPVNGFFSCLMDAKIVE